MARIVRAAIASVLIAAAQDVPRGLALDRVVLLMRHGVRPPTKSPAMPAGVAGEAWPDWPVKPGYLTPNGATAVKLVAATDRARFVTARLLSPNACPRAGAVRIVADSDQLARPAYIARANLAGLAPIIAKALGDRSATASLVTLISGHDTNVASLGGLLGVHWHVPGFAAPSAECRSFLRRQA